MIFAAIAIAAFLLTLSGSFIVMAINDRHEDKARIKREEEYLERKRRQENI